MIPNSPLDYSRLSPLAARAAIYQFGTSAVPFHHWMFDFVFASASSQATVLDVGCGPGTLWRKNRERVPSTWSVLLTDVSQTMVGDAREAFRGDSRFEARSLDANAIALPNCWADIVVADHMLYHTEVPRALSEIARVLQPGGRLVATTNGTHHLARLGEMMQSVGLDGTPAAFSAPFCDGNGATLLSNWFDVVTTAHHSNLLRVTHADVIANYAASLCDAASDEAKLRLRAVAQRDIDERGACIIAAESVVFVATKR